ncbi:Member of major facilitator superfamily multidrug-dha1 sub-family [Mycena sanguinolenta]|uniref:Member of major facilitator superfamily multidrug-dha1 sub-family n=1 Tax=Mycena sanguinolenta TaxID=230812 RepID=A0A8H6ZCR1_9AGAR|nr:Member of major facilitator superfamily multidrug-dha1 sub-family [Mycena sanguinolenta]
MATGYKALLAMGDSHNKSVESTVQAVLAQKKLKEEQRRKQQEEQERKQRELETKLRLRHFEEQKKKAEAEARKEEERKAKEADLLRREAEQRDALRYGPKKAKAVAGSSKWPASDSGVRDEVRRRRVPDDDDDDGPGSMLTREEKRERKIQAELKRAFHAPRKPVGNATHRKPGAPGRRLPGGALNIVDDPSAVATGGGSGSVKERLAAMPNTLTRLNVVKRDTRTIDEIVRDRRENKETVLNGDQARTFDDWFTPSSRAKKEKSAAPSPSPSEPARGQKALTPIPSSSASSSSSRASQLTPASSSKRTALPTPTTRPKPKVPASAPASNAKKRPRSLSLSRSASPPPPKRSHLAPGSSNPLPPRSHSPRAGPSTSALSEEIWGLFGKNKASYVARDVFSDSEDDDDMMEADASALEREEKYSARIARREEREAEEEERRHEEEKRRRKAAMGR